MAEIEKDNDSAQTIVTTVLIITCVLLATFNFVLWQRYQAASAENNKWRTEKQEREKYIKQQAFQEMQSWQQETLGWSHLEDTLEKWNAGKMDQSLSDLEQLMQKQPGQIAYYYLRALTLEKMGENEAAVTDLDTYLEEATSSTWGFFKRSQIHFKLGNYAKALEDIEQALAKKSEWQEAKALKQEIATKMSESPALKNSEESK